MNSPKKYSENKFGPSNQKNKNISVRMSGSISMWKILSVWTTHLSVKAPSQCERAFSILNSSLRHILETIWQYEFVRKQGSAEKRQKRSHNRLGQRSQSDPSFKTRRKGWLLQSIFEVAGLAFFKWFPEMVEWKPLLSRETNSCLFETRPT